MSENNNDDNNIIEVKAILLGDVSVGKTSLINVSVGMPFNPSEKATISSSFVEKKIKICSQEYNINLWDTAGNERFRSLTNIFYKGSQIVIFVYDISQKQSFIGLKKWVEDVENIIDNKYICGIVGNKQDLYSQEEVKEEEVKEYADSKGMKYKLVSAKGNPKGFNDFLEELVVDGKNCFKSKKKIPLKKSIQKKKSCTC